MANLTDTSVNGDLRVTGTMFGTQAGNYATCATAAATAAKAVTISGFTLTTGIHVYVKFTVTNTAAVASLTLNVSGTGAKAMKYRGGNLPAVGTLSASRVYEFIYDGTNWELVGDLDTNTQTVTGVKGNAESSYRTGQVNITPANIGVAATSTSVTVGDTTASIPQATATTPKMDGTAAVGSETKWAKGDHVHPTDTSRAPTSHASSATTYGVGTTANYGHVKLDNSTPLTVGTTSSDGVATGKAHIHNALESVARTSVTTADLAHINTNDRAHMILSQITNSTSTTHDPGDGYMLSFMWDNTGKHDAQLFIPDAGTSANNYGRLKIRYCNNSAWGDWEYLPLAADCTTLTNSDDLDNIKGSAAGQVLGYKWSTGAVPANAPVSTATSSMLVYQTHSAYCYQVVFTARDGVYRRLCNNGTWEAWSKELVAADIATGSANGTISVAGTDVAVKGLGGAAYLNTGTASGTVATGNHTHTTSIASDSSSGTVVALAHDTQYKLTAGGTSVLFKTPADSNTDTKVTQTVDTSNDAAYPLLAKNTTATATITDTSRFTSGVTLNPKNKSITANTLIGALDNRTKSLLEMESAGGSTTKYMILATMTYTGAKEAATSSHADRAAVFCNASSTFTIESRHSGCGIVQVMMQANGYYPDPTTSEGGMTGSINVYTPSGSSRNNCPIRMYRKWTANASTFTPSWTITLLVPDYDWNNFKLKNILQNNGLVFKTSAEYVTATDAELVTTYGTWLASGTIVTTDTKVTQTADNSSTGTGFEVLFSATGDNTTRTETARKSNKLTFQPSTGKLTMTGPLLNTAGIENSIQVSHGIANTNASISMVRTDTNTQMYVGIGSGGTNHGVYSNTNSNWIIKASTSGNVTVNDGKAGTTIYLGNTNVGATNKPMYLASGKISEGSLYAGGTAVTLNGTSKGATTASFYAPESAGINGQIYTSNGTTGAWAYTSFRKYIMEGTAWATGDTKIRLAFTIKGLTNNDNSHVLLHLQHYFWNNQKSGSDLLAIGVSNNGLQKSVVETQATRINLGGKNKVTYYIVKHSSTSNIDDNYIDVYIKESGDGNSYASWQITVLNSGSKSNVDNIIQIVNTRNVALPEGAIEIPFGGQIATASNAVNDSDGNKINSTYLKLSGGTMTGKITAWAGKYTDDGTTCAIDMNNSNIIGLNSIYTADACDGASEGIHFYRASGKYDTLWMAGGYMYFVPNRDVGTSTSAANSRKVAILPTSITSNQMVVTDGTSGYVKGVSASDARTAIGAAASDHTHTTSLVAGGTSTVTLAADTAYTLTAGGTSVVFKTPNNYSHPAGSAASKTGVPTGNVSPGFGGTFKVNQISTDSTSHVSAVTERTITIPNATATASAAGLMSADDYKRLNGSRDIGEHDANLCTANGFYYASSNMPATALGWTERSGGNDGAIFVQAHSSSWVGQIAQDYRTGNLFTRGRNNGTFTSWKRIPYLTVKNKGGTTTPVYIDDNGEIQSCTAYASATVGTATNSTNSAVTADTTHQLYLIGATGSSGQQALKTDTGIYATTTAGQLHATTFDINSKCTLQFNTTTNALDFVFA